MTAERQIVPHRSQQRHYARVSLPAVACSCLAGNLLVHQLPELPGTSWFVPLVLAAVVAFRYPATRCLVWAIAAFMWTSIMAQTRLDDRLPGALSGQDVAVTGWIDTFPDQSAERTVFSFHVNQRRPENIPDRLRLTWYEPPELVHAGATLSLVVRLRPPRGLSNPGGFDYERWLFLQGYGATGYVRSGGPTPAQGTDLRRSWLKVRQQIANRIGAAKLSADARALISALALGERSGFSDDHWRDLRRTGTSHLVAISGMHIGLVAAMIFLLARWLCLRMPNWLASHDLEIAAFAAAATAAAYAALAGFALPTQRALLMLLVAFTVLVSRRAIGAFEGFSAALILVLGIDPLASLTASFWLSFGAVGLILLLVHPQRAVTAENRFFRSILKYLRTFAAIQWSITLGLIPLLSAFFGELSLVAAFVNFIAIPFVSFVLVPLTLFGMVALAFGEIGLHVLGMVGLLADATWAALAEIAGWSWVAIPLSQRSSWIIVLALFGVVMALPWHPLPGRRFAWFALLPLVAAAADRPPEGVVDILVLDVGHGLSALVETADHRLLYDAGPVYRSGFNAGQEIVVPVVARHGRSSMDTLIVSHSDSDHAGGAHAVLAAFPDAKILRGPDVEDFAGAFCRAGQRWVWNEVKFSILHPADGFVGRGNESSCVLKVSTDNGAILFTGDIEARAESVLMSHAEIQADVVVVPHHGSATSSTVGFVAATRANLAVVSASYENRWGFPKSEVRQRWRDGGANMLVTGESGAVSLTLGYEVLQVRAERARRPRYWHAETPVIPGESPFSTL